jgi:hypothetical protein
MFQVQKKHLGALGILHGSFSYAVFALFAFARVVGHSLRPSRQIVAGATLRRDVIAAEQHERQGDLH